MVPSSALGLAVLLCLIPGLLYVRLTERTRHPREDSALLEGVEVLGMGLLSIALVVGPVTLLDPGAVEGLVREPSVGPRLLVFVLAIVVAGSAGAAYALARVRIILSTARYTPAVWSTTFERRPGFVREVMVELTDGRQFQGTLLACTLDPHVEQQVSITAPIMRVDSGEQDLAQERMTFSSAAVATISLVYAPDGSVVGDDIVGRSVARRAVDSVRAGWLALEAEWHEQSTTQATASAAAPAVEPEGD